MPRPVLVVGAEPYVEDAHRVSQEIGAKEKTLQNRGDRSRRVLTMLSCIR